MAKLGEMSLGARLLTVLVVVTIVGVAYYYIWYNPANQANQQLTSTINAKKAENETLRGFEPKLAQLNRDMAILEQQIEREKKVVPDEKDADQFIRLLHDTAATAGIEIRRYTAMPTASHEFYSDVPFAIDIDGPYYSFLNFFQRVSELERIVNIDSLQVAGAKNASAAKVKGTYQYAPGETIVASCTATTFFSHDQDTASATPGPPKPGQPAAAAAPVKK
jgi:type IV pilus assembly protein PilO